MVKKILSAHVPEEKEILARPCTEFMPDDPHIFDTFTDLLETAMDAAINNPMGCVGLSANQIGITKRGFVLLWGDRFIPIMNPKVIKTSEQTVRRLERTSPEPRPAGKRVTAGHLTG